ncbi:hypothetical protein U1Q18_020227 [Sarracenia purpurea var. burkii]
MRRRSARYPTARDQREGAAAAFFLATISYILLRRRLQVVDGIKIPNRQSFKRGFGEDFGKGTGFFGCCRRVNFGREKPPELQAFKSSPSGRIRCVTE